MKTADKKIMVVASDRSLCDRIEDLWDHGPISIDCEPNLSYVLSQFERTTYDVLIITSKAFVKDEIEGIELLEVLSVRCPITQVVFLAEPQHIELALSAIQAGGYQYGKFPISDMELKLLIEAAVANQPEMGQNLLLKDGAIDQFPNIVGESDAMMEVFKLIEQAAVTDIPILITGETGTGKDLVAQAIHNKSLRNGGPFVPVHIGALPSELIGSELFGHEKGAFTGAGSRQEGKFEQGNGGTVFLDEIGTIDEKMQISLLRLLEQKRFHRLGGSALIDVDVRLVAATNENLLEMVEQGKFREDLYFRLDVFRISLPPLRERQGDLRLLLDVFVENYATEFQKPKPNVGIEFLQFVEGYEWPGNIRELKHIIQRAVLVCEGKTLLPEHLPPRLRKVEPNSRRVCFDVGTSLDEIEREMILRTLDMTDNNRKEAAELLGISRRSLYNKLNKHDIS